MKKIVVIASMMLFGYINAYALTPVDTNVTNIATLSYTVGSVAQTSVDSNQNSFLVDRLIDVQVVNDDPSNTVDVTPGSADQILTFTIANQGNGQEEYTVSYEDVASGDDYNPTSCQVDAGSGYVDFTTTITIAQETNATVTVQCDIPATGQPGISDGNDGSIILKATVNNRTNDTNAVDDAATVQNVMADAAGDAAGDAINDGAHSDTATYNIVSADLTITKDSCIMSDPVNDLAPTTTKVHRIPGAVIRYEFEVINNGSAEAKSVHVADNLVGQYGTSSANVEVQQTSCPGTDATTGKCKAKTGSAEGNTHSGVGTASVDINFDTVAAGATECGYMDVTIQ